MTIYGLITLADALFLIAGFLFVRRVASSTSGPLLIVSSVVASLWMLGLGLLVILLSLGLPGCPAGHWAC